MIKSFDGGISWSKVSTGLGIIHALALNPANADILFVGTGNGVSIIQFSHAPATFNKTAPENGAIGASITPTLSWGPSSGATRYEYCYDTTNDNACAAWTGAGTSASVTLPALNYYTTYYWHVRAVGPGGVTYSNGSPTAFWNFQTTTNPNGVTLAVNPAASSVSLNQDFDVAIEVRAGSKKVDGACAYLNFSPTYLQVVKITPGTTLPNIIVNNFEPAGQVNYCAGILANYPSGTFTLATVTFHAKALTTSTPLSYNLAAPRKSDVTYGGNSIQGPFVNGTVEITNTAILKGHVTLQGRPTPPHARWSVPLTVTLTVPGNAQPAYTFTPTTDTSGYFTLSKVTPGTYDVRVKHSHTLRNIKRVTLAAGTNTSDFGALYEGDAKDDNDITLTDFSVLAMTYGKCLGTTGYDGRADFNGDTCIDLVDFSRLATNFGRMGDITVQSTTAEEPLPLAPVTIVVDPAQKDVMAGEPFTVEIKLQA